MAMSTSSRPSQFSRLPLLKRKRSHDDMQHHKEMSSLKLSRQKGSRKSKVKTNADLDLDEKLGLNLAIAKMDNRLLSDYVARRTKRFSSNLSVVELEDLHIPEKAYFDTSDWVSKRTVQNLPSFLEHYSLTAATDSTLAESSNLTGAPHTLILTAAGLRAAELRRSLRVFQTNESVVAKLFAKHIKLNDAIKYVKQTRIGIGVGTPSRVIDLLDAGALSSLRVESLVIDCSYIDLKKRGIFDMQETQQPLMQLLNRPELKGRFGDARGDIHLIVY